MAEIILREKAREMGLDDVVVDSAGTIDYHAGEKPDKRSVAECRKHLGANLEVTHRSRKLRRSDFTEFDYILCMDDSNKEDAEEMAPASYTAKIVRDAPDSRASHRADVPPPRRSSLATGTSRTAARTFPIRTMGGQTGSRKTLSRSRASRRRFSRTSAERYPR